MIETLLLAGLLLPSDTLVFSGRDHQLAVSPPRFEEAGIEIDGRLDEGNWDEAASLVGFTQNLVLDATVNPDFSQVEADDSRITVNERFPQFYPEKRPFFPGIPLH